MKIKIFFVPFLLLCSFSATGCEKKEDGNIADWVGEYQFGANELQHCHRYITGEKSVIKTEDFKKDTDHFIIYPNKTWRIPDSKDLGPKGKIKCYKNYINLLDFSMDYRIESKYKFKFVYRSTEVERKYLEYELDGSDGRTRGEYDYTVRRVSFFFLNKI